MARNLLLSGVASMAIFSLVICSGCGDQAKRVAAPSINASKAAKLALEQFDTDKDGKVAGDELNASPGLKLLDKGQGVTAEMVEAKIKAWQATRYGRTTWNIAVFRNGKPLANATVKYVPEKFLGDSIQMSVGTTNKDGRASMAVPELLPAGAQLGLYRVEITKEGENIPANYNTQTTLGAEVGGAGVGISESFNLKY